MPEITEKPTMVERTKELTDRLEAGMKDLFQSDKYKDYLKSMSHFHNYSSRNIALINMQMPGATKVGSFKLWEEKFNRHVKKGEHGIRIFAPVGNKTPEKVMMEKLDPETKAPLLDENGRIIMEEMTRLTNGPKFKLVPVFDISQTQGEPLPELVENLTGNVAHYEAFLDALKAVSPLPIIFETMPENKDGYCRYGEKIGIREGMSEIQTIAAIVHELTHARLHQRDAGPNIAHGAGEETNTKPRFIKEIEAESVAYVICQHHNIETAPNSFGYLAKWGGQDMQGFKASLDTIRKESNSLINAIDDKFSAICKEREIDLSTKVAEELTPEKPPEPVFTTETHTENIAGVDFTFEEVITQTPESDIAPLEQAAKEPPSSMEPVEIMPDPAIGTAERDLYGYTYDGILPLLKERALELYDQEEPVYLLYDDNTEAMAFDRSEVENFNGIFGIDRDEWQRIVEYTELSAKNTEAAMESDLIHANTDTYGIYQLKSGEELHYHRFAALAQLEKDNIAVDRSNYELVYTAPMPPKETLDDIYQRFNIDHPKDFTGHSLSVSDVVVIQRDGEVSSHYVDSFGFAELPAFLGNEHQPEKIIVTEKADETVKKPLDNPVADIAEDSKTSPPIEHKNQPVYMHSTDTARENGELETYRADVKLNNECRNAIDTAINESRYDTNFYKMKDAAKQVVEEYGSERVELIMAKIVAGAEWDGRYSMQNKEWAKGFEIPQSMKDVYTNTHPCLIDGFIDRLRKEAAAPERKPSILEAIKQGTEKSHQQSEAKSDPKKSKEMEM